MEVRVIDYKTVELSDKNVTEVTRERIKTMLNGDGIERHNGDLWVYEFVNRGHSSGSINHTRQATDIDLALWKVLCLLWNEDQ